MRSFGREFLAFLGIQLEFIHDAAFEFAASSFEFFYISAFQVLQHDILYFHARQRPGALTTQTDTIASDDAVGPGRHLDHISRTYLEKENILAQFLSELFYEIRKYVSFFRIEIKINLIAIDVKPRSHRNRIGETLPE